MTDISLYIHVPFCCHRCYYCSFTSFAGRTADVPGYFEALRTEVRLTRQIERRVRTIYFGGGTPSLVGSSHIQNLIEEVSRNYIIADGAEITLEANPGTASPAYLRELKAAGVNRLSLGAQSLDDDELGFLGRAHTSGETLQAVTAAREAGFDNISLDFIYGLPQRQLEDWKLMLKDIITLSVEHISLYGLTVEEGTPLSFAINSGDAQAPDPDAAAMEYEAASQALNDAGYRHYEISNWGLPGRESRHNMVYWQRGEYLGLGAAAHSFINNRRLANTSDLDDYLAALKSGHTLRITEETIDQQTSLAEAIILGLRLSRGIGADDISRWFGIDLFSRFATEITELGNLGLLEIVDNSLRLTARGRLLGNEVFLRFLP